MSYRIKVTGYISADDLDPTDLDPDDATGLSEQGHLDHIVDEKGTGLKVADLDDVRVEVER